MKENSEDSLWRYQMTDLWEIENSVYEKTGGPVCGVDEAGRGPLAGPVYAAAVILPKGLMIPGLDDSKKLSEKKREELFAVITDSALSFGIARAEVEEIETLNILNATFLAMNRAISMLDPAPAVSLIDGNRNSGIDTESICIIKGDSKCADIAAASILAKVSRDRFMYEMADRYPQYGFDKHKGYGTMLHYEKLREFGPSPIHRLSFLKKMH
ncbi:MAG: ribonuclease HII [Oscillospiraceae bacterium]|nr:ribonuclease HII [Oscillospiraceae bacterium]